jgi:hypothetical protein
MDLISFDIGLILGTVVFIILLLLGFEILWRLKVRLEK